MTTRSLSTFLTSFLLVSLDWVSKLVVLLKSCQLSPHSPALLYSYVWGHFSFLIVPSFNEGAAFGLFAQYKIPLLIFRVFVILCLFLFLGIKFRSLHIRTRIALTLILAGALGNVGDILFHGKVVDFLSINYYSWSFPSFNLADAFISLGTLLLVGHLYFSKEDKKYF
ncbi:lipoprotein signal peptidase [Chlamydia trachomatis]|uniref:Lipoprotein signal peptidase n=2 Tax=Chlamydia muridarum TaxID=83560 RepID=LSPA_CHLMU|nr:signal peptidase II [Chlamydia muridarum]Q9PJY8.1 RecName: Full=Lipoprotein signal peptidase; AltName: Full=Prolipoprotein signal peptidase; AltName: Full=Signal peptidase II; Short=SPase II [Chlamydia muridarum str. Nigg]UFT34917.1 lipoprotein signal peptidase [Chlamydia trachomatis]AAF39505.1 lipoprotein signal peptidase [Chlamydia muridarum str. Nigg]AHH23074.1 peptidase A8 [Chlamydia muridarum str. Nigg3 CMUT3-5]AHH23999.1 peptidase A8 [Chlamydia muridarum str. Nigg CM972]AID38206.1 pe